MKGERVKELFRKLSVKAGAMVLATALVIGGSVWVDQKNSTPIPELVTFVDSDGTILIEEEEVPLATPKVTVSTKTSKKTKKIKMKKASKKTYSKKKTSKKTTTKQSTSSSATTTTQTVTATNVVNKYKKGSKINTQTTTVKTTVTKTVVSNQTSSKSSSTASSTSASTNTAANTNNKTVSTEPTEVAAAKIASAADARVINAYNTLGFKIEINPRVSYAGLFDARTRTITLREQNDTVYHELGHFVAFIAGNVDRSSSFQQVYAAEKSKYTAANKAYVLSTPSEYFAESFKNYTLNPAELKANRPQTYAAIEAAVNTITSDHVAKVAGVYKSVWN